jgi:beta-lactam-binding protein with PASTA domain
VKHNRKVYLYVTGLVPPQVSMPKLTDMSERQARIIISSYGLKVGRVYEKEADCNGCVIMQMIKGKEIEPGNAVKKGSVVELVVGIKDSYLSRRDTVSQPGDDEFE